MPKHSCPRCHRPLPFAARSCGHCDWISAEGERATRGLAARSRRRFWVATLLALLVTGTGIGYVYMDGIASRYAAFAARYLPAGASALAPTDTDEGAFYYCIRSVAKEMDEEASVQTFPARVESNAVTLDGGAYQIRSYVDEARESGERVRHNFTCTVRFAKGRWMLEDLAIERPIRAPLVAERLQSE